MSGILSFFSSKTPAQQLEELKVDYETKIQTLQKQVDEEAKAKAAAVIQVDQPAAAVATSRGGRRRRKTSRKSPSKKRATKSMYNKIKKWNPFKKGVIY